MSRDETITALQKARYCQPIQGNRLDYQRSRVFQIVTDYLRELGEHEVAFEVEKAQDWAGLVPQQRIIR